ncbi:hypothetical protein GCM10010211_19680 [Streptomyces albospinus]|uniref:MarR family transcriptional regulator n=1 Tax=Streptomyces albospinus TaxID=285515 RepID=A0ABQ2UUT8_9ACTN|nr:hypothetical protein [Streptomyces albospinus]GGU55060.1 hypothetical protein GCM10010211_19680 [Streptomyces albospinus]
MTVPLSPPEALLALGADYNRHNDALNSLAIMEINRPNPATAVSQLIPRTRHLTHSALHIVDALNHQRMYHSPGIRSAYARIRQLAHLALDAADHLLDAEDILDDARVGAPSEDGPPLTLQEARSEVRDRLVLVRDLTALGADDTLATAELLATEMRRQRLLPAGQLLDLSPAQHTALRAVAQGHVTIDRHNDKPRVSRDDLRISISTIRSLETRGLVGREETPRVLHDERIHLTSDGCRTLAAGFGQVRPPALTTARPVQVKAASAPARSR